MPGHGLAALPWDGLALLLRVVEAVLLGHVVALLVPDNVARLRWHVLALLPLHLNSRKRMKRGLLQILGGLRRLLYLSGHDTTLLGGDIAADRPRAAEEWWL